MRISAISLLHKILRLTSIYRVRTVPKSTLFIVTLI